MIRVRVQYTEEDYYAILSQREVIDSDREIGCRTQLVSDNLENDFLNSSESSPSDYDHEGIHKDSHRLDVVHLNS